ncbi:double-stranded RNA-binding protein 5 [Dorcoceras hygrometricum]|uniref:Double-stranded RNA-binding protein 5 n=1 Tax=Dorcoceras hygrometricum TaxID=472368 RepID=A0A2Z7D6J6_9LAMI|nr:double-stranded RNA-binding protein 5 [Dorcoceras hygrometricum]
MRSVRYRAQCSYTQRPRAGRRVLRPLAGHRARLSCTVLRGACRPPSRIVRAGGRPRAHALRVGSLAACGVAHGVRRCAARCAGGGAPPCGDSEAALRRMF